MKAHYAKCPGAAHVNPFIDNCLVCMPHWAIYPTCPRCGQKLRGSKGDWCRTCRKHYELRDDTPACEVSDSECRGEVTQGGCLGDDLWFCEGHRE